MDARRAEPLRLFSEFMRRDGSWSSSPIALGCNCTSSDCTSSELVSVVSDVELMRDGSSLIAEAVGFGLPSTDENSPGIPDQEGEIPTPLSKLSFNDDDIKVGLYVEVWKQKVIGSSRSADAKVRSEDCRSLVIAGVHRCQCSRHGPHRLPSSVPI